jgi:hypothetical protein
MCTEMAAFGVENDGSAGGAMPHWPLLPLSQHCPLPGSAARARRSTAGSKRFADYVLGGEDEDDGEATARVSSRGRPLSAPRRTSDASDCGSAPRARKAQRAAQQPHLLLALLAVAAAEAADQEQGDAAASNEQLLAAQTAAELAARCAALVNALGV